MPEAFVKFLGTGGARYVVARQVRSSAGVFLRAYDQNVIIDPGPGTLVKCAKSRPSIDVTKLDAIILTHSHIDHSSDINVLIDAMTVGGERRKGRVFAPRQSLDGGDRVLLNYLRNFPDEIVALEEKKNYTLGNLKFATSVKHRHPPETYGVIFTVNDRRVGFLVDTGYFEGLAESYLNVDVLIVNTVLRTFHPGASDRHLSFEDLEKLIDLLLPGKVVMTHFGMKMLKARPWVLAKEMSKKKGVEVVAASDGLKLDIW